MEKIQHKISKYMIQNGITIAHVARMTGIDYEMLRRSLRENRVLTADDNSYINYNKFDWRVKTKVTQYVVY